MKYLQDATQIALRLELQSIDERLKSLDSKSPMIQDLIRFNEMRFEQGKIEYDALVRSKIEMLSLQSEINALEYQRAQLMLKINQPDTSFTQSAKSIEAR